MWAKSWNLVFEGFFAQMLFPSALRCKARDGFNNNTSWRFTPRNRKFYFFALNSLSAHVYPVFLAPSFGPEIEWQKRRGTFRLARYAYTFTRFTEVFDEIKGDEEGVEKRKYFSKPDKNASVFHFDLLRVVWSPPSYRTYERESNVEKSFVLENTSEMTIVIDR